jgi:hypothetical protein
MRPPDVRSDIQTESDLLALFEAPREASLVKELDHIDDNYAAWIRASPFFMLATAGAEGLDASPRGDPPGFVEVLDPKTLIVPERRGNNRIDSLRNLLVDNRVALLFLLPGLGETLRVNGRARINADPETLARFTLQGRAPKVVLVVTVEAAYFQCSRAIVRSDLWSSTKHIDRSSLPTPGKILADATTGRIDGNLYDRELPERIKGSLY